MKMLAGALLVLTLAAQGEEIADAPGAIQEVNAGNGWYAIVPDGDRGTRYAPDRLPDEFKNCNSAKL